MKIYERYKGHAKALSKSGLAPEIYPTPKEIWKKVDTSKLNNNAKREKLSRERECTMHFGIGFSKIWREKIYKIIRKKL